ncbi:hypothetical protein ACQ4WX_44635 [Streptomyces lasalocidi]
MVPCGKLSDAARTPPGRRGVVGRSPGRCAARNSVKDDDPGVKNASLGSPAVSFPAMALPLQYGIRQPTPT